MSSSSNTSSTGVGHGQGHGAAVSVGFPISTNFSPLSGSGSGNGSGNVGSSGMMMMSGGFNGMNPGPPNSTVEDDDEMETALLPTSLNSSLNRVHRNNESHHSFVGTHPTNAGIPGYSPAGAAGSPQGKVVFALIKRLTSKVRSFVSVQGRF